MAVVKLKSLMAHKALEAVKEATGIDPTQATAGMKKAQVVAYCATKLEGTRWLPSPLRRIIVTEGMEASTGDLAILGARP